MTSRLAITGGVAMACLAAAGVGGFLAVRTAMHTSEAATVTTPAATSTVETPAPASEPAARVVATRNTPAPQTRRYVAETQAPAIDQQIAQAAPTLPEPVAATPEPPALDAPTSASAVPVGAGESIALPGPRFEQIELPSNAVIGIRIDTTVSSDTAQVEDRVEARVTRPVVVDGRTVIPTGARLAGVVTVAERGGRFHERSRIGVQFSSVTINDVRVPIRTEAIYRIGDAPTGEATAKIGASAVIGSILGGVFGGKKGAAIGGAAGAAGGTAVVAAGGPNEVTLASGSTLTLRLSEPARFEVER